MAGEVQTVGVSDATPQAMEQLRQERADALQDYMTSVRGAPTLEQAQGITSQAPIYPTNELTPQQAQQQNADNRAQQDAQAAQEAAHWKKLYGDSENEKGELRRQAEALAQAKQQLEEQMALQAAMQAAQMGSNPYQPYAPQTGAYPQAPQYGAPTGNFYQPPPAAPPQWGPQRANFDPFNGRSDDDVWTTRDVKTLVNDTLAPIMDNAYMQAQQAAHQAAQLQAQMYAQAKIAAGVTPLAEQKVLMANPWLQGVQDPFARLNAIKALMPKDAPATPASVAAPAPQGVQLARERVTYVETGRATTATDNRPTAQQVLEQEWAATMALPLHTGERAKAQEALLRKNGVQEVANSGGWLTR